MDDWRALVRHMIAAMRIEGDVRVRRVRMPRSGNHGKTSLKPETGRITVTINADDDPAVQVDTLDHELAHAKEMAKWGCGGKSTKAERKRVEQLWQKYNPHGPTWGRYLAEAYRARLNYYENVTARHTQDGGT